MNEWLLFDVIGLVIALIGLREVRKARERARDEAAERRARQTGLGDYA